MQIHLVASRLFVSQQGLDQFLLQICAAADHLLAKMVRSGVESLLVLFRNSLFRNSSLMDIFNSIQILAQKTVIQCHLFFQFSVALFCLLDMLGKLVKESLSS